MLGDVGEEISIKESIDDDVVGLEVNIEGAEMEVGGKGKGQSRGRLLEYQL